MRSRATRILFAAAILLAVAPPAGASAAVLFDQTAALGAAATESTSSPPPADGWGADDFVVPAGQQWTVTEVDAVGAGGDPAGPPTTVRIYADAGGAPAATPLFQEDGIAASPGPNFKAPLAKGPTLGPGTYWVSVSSPGLPSPWAWRNSTQSSGSPAVWQNPSGLFLATLNRGCSSWKARSFCFPGTEAEPGQAFTLIGPEPVPLPSSSKRAKPSNAFTLGAFKRDKKNGTGRLTVVLPGPGKLVLSGVGLTTSEIAATSAGPIPMYLQLEGKALRKLDRKRRVKVTASLVFTPTGGDPATETKTVTLKKKKKRHRKRKKAAASR